MKKNFETIVKAVYSQKNIAITLLCMVAYTIMLLVVSANADAKTLDDTVEETSEQIIFTESLSKAPTIEVQTLEFPKENMNMAEYYKNLYRPKPDSKVHVGKYSFDYIPGAPFSVYEAKAAGLEEEKEETVEVSETERFSENTITVESTTIPVPIETTEEEIVEEVAEEPTVEYTEIEPTDAAYTPHDLQYHGTFRWNGSKWTWYSEKVLPGGGLNIPGRHLDDDGFVCDEDGYICLAADGGYLSKGTVVDTPFGRPGKVYDCGCDYGTIDVYVGW